MGMVPLFLFAFHHSILRCFFDLTGTPSLPGLVTRCGCCCRYDTLSPSAKVLVLVLILAFGPRRGDEKSGV